jgi:hypothetical protein
MFFSPRKSGGLRKRRGINRSKKQSKEVLSSEMDQAHSTGLETSRRFFRKIRPSTIEREPFEA